MCPYNAPNRETFKNNLEFLRANRRLCLVFARRILPLSFTLASLKTKRSNENMSTGGEISNQNRLTDSCFQTFDTSNTFSSFSLRRAADPCTITEAQASYVAATHRRISLRLAAFTSKLLFPPPTPSSQRSLPHLPPCSILRPQD